MRLAQLARKLNVTQSEITRILTKAGYDSGEHGNTKLSDEEVATIYKHFGHQEDTDTPTNEESDEMARETLPVAEDEVAQETEAPQDEPAPTPSLEKNTDEAQQETSEAENTSNEEVEVIRAKKVKLEGIKVVGKIDLPEPKTKDPEKEEKENKTRRKQNKRKSRHKQRKQLSYEEKLQREEKKKEISKTKRLKKLKEKKKRHYFENVQPKTAPGKPKKKTKKVTDNSTGSRKKETPRYKNPLRKFWAWLNGEYDVG